MHVFTFGGTCYRTLEHLEREVEKDTEEDKLYGKDKRGDELPEDLRDRDSRLRRLKACKERLEREKAQAKQAQQKKIDDRLAKEKATGKKARGRRPKSPEEIENKDAKANVTDPQSRIMTTRKGYEQAYNAQAVVTE